MTKYVPLVIASLALGLAPFTEEPHLIGKIRWVAGGAVGMAPIDWFDLVLHGAPIVVLVGVSAFGLVRFLTRRGAESPPEDGTKAG